MSDVHVQLPELPFWPNDVATEDRALLDQLGSDFVSRCGGEAPEVVRFLYGDLPVIAFDRIFDGEIADLGTGAILWMFHISGYLGGVWLRGEIDKAQEQSQLSGIALPPSREGFDRNMADAQRGLEAAAASDDEVLAYNRASLFPAGDAAGITNGLVENFGYNQGYLLEILESPPAGLSTPKGYSIHAAGPLACAYESPKLGVLPRFRPIETALAQRSKPVYADLASRIEPIQAAGVAKGRGVWSGGLSVQGFPPQEYELLLNVSSSYLEDVQATVLATVQAVAEEDAEIGRRAAIANSAMGLWLASYGMGLMEGRKDGAAPRFA
jgi:hypothetical protein